VIKEQNDVSVITMVDGILDSVFDTQGLSALKVAAWGCMPPQPLGGVESSVCQYTCQGATPRPGLSVVFSLIGLVSVLLSWLPCF